MGTSVEAASDDEDDAAVFRAFFEAHYAELARLAHLLTGEADAADDLAADALVALWKRWDRVRAAEHPVAYARGVVANLARSRIRSAVRERRRIALFWSQRTERVEDPDVPAVLDLREALQRLPFRKRACVVLRHAFDLSERDTARALGISVGTVKSQTSRGVAELERLLAQGTAGHAVADGRTEARTVRPDTAEAASPAAPAPGAGPSGAGLPGAGGGPSGAGLPGTGGGPSGARPAGGAAAGAASAGAGTSGPVRAGAAPSAAGASGAAPAGAATSGAAPGEVVRADAVRADAGPVRPAVLPAGTGHAGPAGRTLLGVPPAQGVGAAAPKAGGGSGATARPRTGRRA